ncbi:MAG: orotidine-5'-phosphate decarboxylase [Bacteroidales bacterium]|jgi:orotidine-5'-phosphate decarboxylase|nr:orotidine-5'-phosphate decarboxylase [Bacteroidales bacterium]
MNRQELIAIINKKKSFLCVGLDSEISKIPPHLLREEDPVFEFNRQIIDATIDFAVAYKPNLAFYESSGMKGWISLEKTISYLHMKKDRVFLIADAKRGDIGNTSAQYAKAFFDILDVDAITVAPYMGSDSVTPFLAYPEKWVILLALTSNKGASDFQYLRSEGSYLFEHVIHASSQWGSPANMMYVVGATQAQQLETIRKIIPDHFLLVPGIGAQGGSLGEVARYGMTKDVGLLVNASRSIIFASSKEDFAEKAREEAEKVQKEMEALLK